MERSKLSLVGSLVRDLARALVDAPDEVGLREVQGEQVTVLEVSVRKADHGKVVGRGGRLATAIRDILTAIGGACKHRYILEILEEPAPDGRLEPSYSRHDGDPVRSTAELLERLIRYLVDMPSQVRVNALEGLNVAVFELLVAPEDNRRVIGIKGRTISACRELISSMGHKVQRKFLLALVEGEG